MNNAQAYMQPQVVVMPAPQKQTNGLAVFGFFVALIGLFIPTGIVAMFGLVLCLIALGRGPRFLAGLGVIVGLIGTIGWLAVMILAALAGVVAVIGVALFSAAAFVITQPEVVEVTSDMINVAIAVEEYRQDNEAMPEAMADLHLGVATTTDPWGGDYRFALADCDPGFDIISGGPDGTFDTSDDIHLGALDRIWEQAFEDFGEKMEEFGQRMERMNRQHGGRYRIRCDSGRVVTINGPCVPVAAAGPSEPADYASLYEAAAAESLVDEADGDDE